MGITVKRRGNPPRFNAEAVAREIKKFAPGAITGRTELGLDINGQPFAPYSRRYRNFLKRGGEDQKIDLRLSGGLMNSVKARDAILRADSVEVTIAPDTGTSPVWAPKAGGKRRYNRAKRRFEKMSAAGDYSTHLAGRQASKAYRMERTGKQSPPHNVVGYWLHYGTPTMRARPWMGLDPKQRAYLLQMIARVMWR
jgi:hypothetical protein